MSRTLGDADAKLSRFGGNPMCVVCKPDIKEIDLKEKDDFLLIGCDGVFDKMTNKDVIRAIWNNNEYCKDYHKFTGNGVDNLMNEVFMSRSSDNISVIMITFENYHRHFNEILHQKEKYRRKKIEEGAINEIEY